MSPKEVKPDDSIIHELEAKLAELQPNREEPLAEKIKSELEKNLFAYMETPKSLQYSNDIRSQKYAFAYGFGGFLLGAVAMFVCMLCWNEQHPKVVVHEVVREISVTPTATEEEKEKNAKPVLAETQETVEEPKKSSWNIFSHFGFEPEKRWQANDLDKILERQRELANRPRPSTPRFVMQPFRPSARENSDSQRTYREFLETQSQYFNL